MLDVARNGTKNGNKSKFRNIQTNEKFRYEKSKIREKFTT